MHGRCTAMHVSRCWARFCPPAFGGASGCHFEQATWLGQDGAAASAAVMDHGRRRRARAARRAVRFLPRCKGRTTKEDEEEQQQQQQLVRSSTKCAACLGSTSLVQAGGGLSYYTASRYLRLVLRAVLVCACAHAVTPSWSSSSSRSTRPTGPWIDHSPHTLSVVYQTGHGVEETQASGTHDDGTTAWRGTLPGQGPRLNWGGQPTCSLARSLTWTAGSPLPCMRCRRFRP